MVAPYRDYNRKYGEFSQYEIDTGIAQRVGKLVIFNSLDDDAPIQTRAQELSVTLPNAKIIELDGFGHFRIGHNMRDEVFHQLFEELMAP